MAALFKTGRSTSISQIVYLIFNIERLSHNKTACSKTIKIQMAFIIYNRYLCISDCISDNSIERVSHLHRGCYS